MKKWEVHAITNGEQIRLSVSARTKGRAISEVLSEYPDLIIDRVDRLPQY